MKNIVIILFCLFLVCNSVFTQQLTVFNVNMKPADRSFLSITNKKAYTESEAADVKTTIDLGLILTKDDISPKLEWYNLSGKDGKIPEKLIGTSTKIIGLSFDRDQFDKCKTSEDLKRMTGHLTPNSFSHFAVISHTKNEINYHCFIAETDNGKRALIWVSKGTNDDYKIEVRQQP